MSNGSRHALGVVAGLLLPPLIAVGLWYGIGDIQLRSGQAFELSWLGVAVVAASAIVLAFLAGSRVSPIASLLGGLGFTALGALPLLEVGFGLRILPDRWLPGVLLAGFQTVAYTGTLLFVGVVLLAVSAFPSRWRSSAEPLVYSPAYAPPTSSPYLPQNGPEDATRPMHRE
ncbi:hypothetical protein ACFLIM_37815 [Nonomuraea sp. M3C6]|uniref:Uncharacterized protein n=1 Tax=Nonomuraea marmarensis TaxID=3351344 RepID=A0ABW7ASB7_9ACTN